MLNFGTYQIKPQGGQNGQTDKWAGSADRQIFRVAFGHKERLDFSRHRDIHCHDEISARVADAVCQ